MSDSQFAAQLRRDAEQEAMEADRRRPLPPWERDYHMAKLFRQDGAARGRMPGRRQPNPDLAEAFTAHCFVITHARGVRAGHPAPGIANHKKARCSLIPRESHLRIAILNRLKTGGRTTVNELRDFLRNLGEVGTLVDKAGIYLLMGKMEKAELVTPDFELAPKPTGRPARVRETAYRISSAGLKELKGAQEFYDNLFNPEPAKEVSA
jgi:hypothetical protein